MLLAAMAFLFMLVSPLAASAASGHPAKFVSSQAAPSPWSAPQTVYIPDSGHSIDGVFLDYWRNNNGINNYGDPVTAEIEENGHTVQYYQYARFEYWPEDTDGDTVHLANIGEELKPKAVLRTSFGGVSAGEKGVKSNQELAASARSWVALDQSKASAPDTDTWRYVPETGHSVQNGFKEFWENSGEADYLGNPLTEEFRLNGTTYQVFERGELAWQQGKDPWMVELGTQLARTYGVSLDPTPQGDLPTYSEDLFVAPPGGDKWIEVSLSQQYLWAWEGNTLMLETYVSTGRDGFETPEGTFYINTKLLSQTMSGVIGGEYYNVPDVPWVMYFTDLGHALHGTYWHNNFGTPMSHGCVNLPMDVAEWMYGWAPIGTEVVIHD